MTDNREEFNIFIGRVYRTLLALTGSESIAERGTVELSSPVATRLMRVRNPRQFEIWLSRTIVDRAAQALSEQDRKSEETKEATTADAGIVEAEPSTPKQTRDPFQLIAALPEEVRPWAALRLASGMSHRLVSEALGLNPRSASQIEESLSAALMSVGDAGGSRSLSSVESDLTKRIRLHPIPDSLLLQAQDAITRAHRQQHRGTMRVFRPALIAAGVSLVIALVVVAIQVRERLIQFPGTDHLQRLLVKAGKLDGKDFDEIEANSTGFKDWLFLASSISEEGKEIGQFSPPVLNFSVRNARLFKAEGTTVVEGISESGDTTVFLLSASQLGITMEEEERWYPFQSQKWAAAAKRTGDTCIVLATTKGRKALNELINGQRP